MKDWKIVAVFSGSAFVLSIIAGIAGGVSFPVLLLRALAGVIVFGGMGYGAVYVLRKFLPELFESESESEVTAEEAVESEEQNGRNVDIVIEDEDDDTSAVMVEGAEVPESGVNMEEEVLIPAAGTVEDTVETVVEENTDELPNIEAFSDTFSSAELEQGNEESLTGSAAVDIMGQEEDPGTVAKAIRTMMKKDQEG